MDDNNVDSTSINNTTDGEAHITSPTFNKIDFQALNVADENSALRLPWDMSFSHNQNDKLRSIKLNINSIKSRLK